MPEDELVPADERLTTPFEDWCESVGLHPEQPGAWELYSQVTSAPVAPEESDPEPSDPEPSTPEPSAPGPGVDRSAP